MDKIEPIILKYEDGREYTLEFNRNSVVFAEKNGCLFSFFTVTTIIRQGP